MKKNGRPTDFTEEKFEAICEELATGIPLAEICRREGMPHPSTLRDWARKTAELSHLYARARENGEEIIADNLRKTARGELNYSTGDVKRDKLVIETDFKLLKVFNPKKYGDSTTIKGDKENPIDISITIDKVKKAIEEIESDY